MYYHMEIFKKVDVIVTPTTGYVYVTNNCGKGALYCNGPLSYDKIQFK